MSLEKIDFDRHVEDFGSNGLRVFRHPLCVQAPWMDSDFEKQNAQKYIEYKQEKLSTCTDPHEWVFLHARPFRLEAWLQFPEPIHNHELLLNMWIDSENPYVNTGIWEQLFQEHQEDLKHTLKDLPDTFTIYRGGNYVNNLSWTLSEETAKFFATRWNRDTPVHKRVVKKSDVYAYVNDLNEQEVICRTDYKGVS